MSPAQDQFTTGSKSLATLNEIKEELILAQSGFQSQIWDANPIGLLGHESNPHLLLGFWVSKARFDTHDSHSFTLLL